MSSNTQHGEIVKKRQNSIEEFEKALFKKRDIYNGKILELVPMLNSLSTIGDMQTSVHNVRHEIFDELINNKLKIVKYESELKERKTTRIKQLRQLDQYKYDYREVENVVEGEFTEHFQRLGIFKIYIEYLQGCISEIDKLGYSIKTKIAIELGK